MHSPQLQYPEAARALIVGESITDVVVDGQSAVDHAGGSPLNVSFGLARLGLPTAFLSDIGDDDRGVALEAHLRSVQVDLVLERVRDRRSATATTTIGEDGSASYTFDIDWALPVTGLDHGASTLVHFGSIAAFLAPGAQQVETVVERARSSAIVTYDPNIRPQLLPALDEAREMVQRHLALSDVAKASDEDLAWLYPGVDLQSVAESWLDAGPAIVIVTCGSDGAFIATRGGLRLTLPAQLTTVVDTIGAGDSFTAALIAGLALAGIFGAQSRASLADISKETITAIVTRATRCAAITVSRAGANPPTAQELHSWQATN